MPLPIPDATSRTPLRPADFRDWTEYYWTYQQRLTREYLVPCLREWGRWRDGVRVLDVGCGDGGASVALAESGAVVKGFDLDPRRVAGAAERATRSGFDVRLGVADITDLTSLEEFGGPFDLVLFRDVLEHIPDVRAALRHARERLAAGGGIVVIYPPYWSAYGGHQQILHPPRRLGLRWAKLPFVHWLPRPWWHALASGPDGEDPEWTEIETIRRARLTVTGLAAHARASGLRVERARRFLLRPSFRLRYGTPVWGAGALGALPGLREVVVTGSWELLVSASDA